MRFIITRIETPAPGSAIPPMSARRNLFIPGGHLNICGGVYRAVAVAGESGNLGTLDRAVQFLSV